MRADIEIDTTPEGAMHRTMKNIGHNLCRRFSELLAEFQNELKTLQSHVKDNEKTINDLLEPEYRLDPNNTETRTKRGLINAIGKISKSLFGTATEEEVQIIARHVNSLEKFVDTVAEDQEQFREHLDSLTVTTNRRITSALDRINRNF